MPHTLVCFESPFRIAATLKAAFAAFGDRQAAACIELTKLHERVHRAFLSDLIEIFDNKKIKGEVTLVFAGSNLKFAREAAAPSPGEKPARRESV